MKDNKIKDSKLLTILFPLLGLYYSIFKLNWRQKKWVLIIFITIFGSIMQFPENSDAETHKENVYSHYVGLSKHKFFNELKHIITLDPLPQSNDDVYIHVISYLTGSILNWPSLFFIIVSFIFGYFYINALSKILKWNKNVKIQIISILLILLFIIYRGIDSMQSIRSWTGAWVLFNGVVGYFQTKQKKYWLFILSSPLIHAAYFLMAIPAYLIVLFNNKIPFKIIIFFYFASFLITIPSEPIIQQLNRTELGQNKVRSYYTENKNQNEIEMQEGNWYVKYGKKKALHWGSNFMAFTLILFGFYEKKMTRLEAGLFSTGLLMAIFANLGDFFYAFYNRTMINSGLYILATTILLTTRGQLFNKTSGNLILKKIMIWISILIFIPKIVYTIANLLYYTSIYIFAFPFIGWIDSDLNVSIREVISLLI